MFGPEMFAVAFLGGIVPSLIWLGFWLFEDRCEPEPKLRIVLTFISGMAAVIIVYYLEVWVAPLTSGIVLSGVPILEFFVWAMLEETLKFGAAAVFGLSSSSYDEPIDAIIYLSTAALGFAAAENALFLFTSLHSGTFAENVLSGDMRFIGATLLHTLSSATLGLCMAYAFYKSRMARYDAAALGLILAVLLHTLFNFFILQAGGETVFFVFLFLWAGIITVLFFIEHIKRPARDYC